MSSDATPGYPARKEPASSPREPLRGQMCVDRCHGKDKPDRRTVGIRYDESLPADPFLLRIDCGKMIWIQFRNQKRNVCFHPMTSGITDYGESRFGQRQFCLGRNVRRKSGQYKVAGQSRLAGLYGHFRDGFRNRQFQVASAPPGRKVFLQSCPMRQQPPFQTRGAPRAAGSSAARQSP